MLGGRIPDTRTGKRISHAEEAEEAEKSGESPQAVLCFL
jgi:hypothetical protein